jgi:hypothetical protein
MEMSGQFHAPAALPPEEVLVLLGGNGHRAGLVMVAKREGIHLLLYPRISQASAVTIFTWPPFGSSAREEAKSMVSYCFRKSWSVWAHSTMLQTWWRWWLNKRQLNPVSLFIISLSHGGPCHTVCRVHAKQNAEFCSQAETVHSMARGRKDTHPRYIFWKCTAWPVVIVIIT